MTEPPPFTPKRYLSGTHRTREPEETYRLIAPHFGRVGITRVADITGLDTVGIPVCVAVRPNAHSLSVSQGKGLDLMAAKVSAAMEAIELYHAEQVLPPPVAASYRDLAARAAVCHPLRLSLRAQAPDPYHDDLPLLWLEGWEMVRGEPIFVPYDLVHCSFLPTRRPSPFFVSSNGLASGNHPLEATIHALCELIERDATHLWELSRRQMGTRPEVLALETVASAAARSLIERLQGAGLAVRLWNLTSDVGVPVLGCAIFEERATLSLDAIGLFQGFGCHPDREVALCRALTEAAQSRLTYISGARDDIYRDSYAAMQSRYHRAGWARLLDHEPRRLPFAFLPSWQGTSLEDDLATLLACLHRAGFEQVITVDLSQPDIGIPVIRVIVPDLLRPTEGGSLPLTPRSQRHLLREALAQTLRGGRS